MTLRADELVSRIRLPRRGGEWVQYYRKVGTRKAQAISKVCFAAAARMDGGRLRMSGLRWQRRSDCYSVPSDGGGGEGGDIEAAKAAFAREMAPIDDRAIDRELSEAGRGQSARRFPA